MYGRHVRLCHFEFIALPESHSLASAEKPEYHIVTRVLQEDCLLRREFSALLEHLLGVVRLFRVASADVLRTHKHRKNVLANSQGISLILFSKSTLEDPSMLVEHLLGVARLSGSPLSILYTQELMKHG